MGLVYISKHTGKFFEFPGLTPSFYFCRLPASTPGYVGLFVACLTSPAVQLAFQMRGVAFPSLVEKHILLCGS